MLTLDPLKPYKWAILGASALLACATSFGAGWKVATWRAEAAMERHLRGDKEYEARLIATIRTIDGSTQRMSSAVNALREQKIAAQADLFNALERKTYVYVPMDTPAAKALHDAGGLPLGFVQLHNAAARAIDPDTTTPPGSQGGDPTGIELPDLATVISRNYQLYHQCKADLSAWDQWYDSYAVILEDAQKKGISDK